MATKKKKQSTKKLSFRKTSPLKILLAVVVVTAVAGIGTYLLTRSNAATAGGFHTCQVRVSDKTLWCWGANESGQLGTGDNINRNVPTKVNIAGVASVSAGSYHTCATKTDGTLWCWGSNGAGQLGIGLTLTTNTSSHPDKNVPTQLYIAGVASVSAGNGHTCATKTDGTLWCWGWNSDGELGIGNTTGKFVPTQLYIAGVASVSTGNGHTCATRTDGTLWCWGLNSDGVLGIGNTTGKFVPTKVNIAGVASVSTGNGHTCATRTDGTLWCWGLNSDGVLGIGNTTGKFVPTKVNIAGVASVSAGTYHTCAKKTDGTLWCWGNNDYGELGIGTQGVTTNKNVPTQLYIAGVASVSAGSYHTCATKTDGTLWCWGLNDRGQLGIGNATNPNSYPNKNVPTQLYFIWK